MKIEANSPDDYISKLPEDRQAAVKKLKDTIDNYKLNKLTINFLIKIDFYKTTNFLNPDTKINSIFIGKFKNHYLYDIQKMI